MTIKEIEQMYFLKKILQKEVKKLRPQKRKRIIKTLQIIQMSSMLILGADQIAFAETPTTSLVEGLPEKEAILELVMWLIGVFTIGGVGIGVLWLLATRLLYFHPEKKKHAMVLTLGMNAIKGITEIILAPTIVGIILVVSYLLLGKSPFFHLPF